MQKIINQIEELLPLLTEERLEKVQQYIHSLLDIDDELLDLKEEQAVQICGYNPTSHIDDWEWERQLKANELSLEKEKRNDARTRKNDLTKT